MGQPGLAGGHMPVQTTERAGTMRILIALYESEAKMALLSGGLLSPNPTFPAYMRELQPSCF
jgi:hypothetical protein